MCGIVGGIAERNVAAVLIEGLKRLEYRGYDSAGLALLDDGDLRRERQVGKVSVLEDAVVSADLRGQVGIAHTRWATHGKPSQDNAHPHQSGPIVVVHNGIIENYQALKAELTAKGYRFESETDTESAAHLINDLYQQNGRDLLKAVQAAQPLLHGAYALGVLSTEQPDELIAMRAGSPLVIGVGIGENFLASDQLALLPVTSRFVHLDEGDIARLTRDQVEIYHNGQPVVRAAHDLDISETRVDKDGYKHYMLKEIHEQPTALSRTIAHGASVVGNHYRLNPDFLGDRNALAGVTGIQILACGTSYNAGLVARYWAESLLGLPCQVEIASEYRYRDPVLLPNTLLVCISQSGETADTLAALRDSQKRNASGLVSLAVCNVPTSSLVRETDLHFLTQAGPEIGVASTKAFTTQLAALMLVLLELGQVQNRLQDDQSQQLIRALWQLPALIGEALQLDGVIEQLARHFVEKRDTLFLGRGVQFPIALEGALKLKEISYIHAEGYAAGELKHGPLALVDQNMPVVILAPSDGMLDKLKSNMQEVQARGGELFVFTDAQSQLVSEAGQHVVSVPSLPQGAELLSPVLYSIPVQLLSYHVAVLRGTDVDQPRNLAKSVTVE